MLKYPLSFHFFILFSQSWWAPGSLELAVRRLADEHLQPLVPEHWDLTVVRLCHLSLCSCLHLPACTFLLVKQSWTLGSPQKNPSKLHQLEWWCWNLWSAQRMCCSWQCHCSARCFVSLQSMCLYLCCSPAGVLLFQSSVGSQGRQGAPVLELSAALPLPCVGRDPLLPEMLSCHFCGTRLRRRVRLTGVMERGFSSCFTSCHQWEEIKAYLLGRLWVWEISSVYMDWAVFSLIWEPVAGPAAGVGKLCSFWNSSKSGRSNSSGQPLLVPKCEKLCVCTSLELP